MPRHVARLGHPTGGRRVTSAEVARRLAHVEALLLDGQPRAAVVEALRRRGCSPRTADDYIRRVRERWAADSTRALAEKRSEAEARVSDLVRQACKRGAFGAAVAGERLLAELRGLRAPVELRATATVAAAVTPAPAAPRPRSARRCCGGCSTPRASP